MFAIAADHQKGFVSLFALEIGSDKFASEILNFDSQKFIIFDDIEMAENYCELLSNIFMDLIFIVVEL